jgi:hypothetical protein
MAATSSTPHESAHGSHDYDGGSRYPKPLCFAEQRHHVAPPRTKPGRGLTSAEPFSQGGLRSFPRRCTATAMPRASFTTTACTPRSLCLDLALHTVDLDRNHGAQSVSKESPLGTPTSP